MTHSRWIEWSFDHYRSILLALVLLLLGGIIAYNVLPKESTPDIKIPCLYVSAIYEGASPEDVERLILRPLEQRLRTVEGLKTMQSTGFEGGGYINLEFVAGSDIDAACLKVRQKVDEAQRDLPKDMQDPTVHEINLSLFPVLSIMLTGDLPERTLFHLAERLKDAIEAQVPSVLEARLVGSRKEQVEIVLEAKQIEALSLSFEEVISAFSRNNTLISAGRLEGQKGQFSITVPGLIASVEDVMKLPLVVHGEAAVHLKDVATVRRGYKDRESYARHQGIKTVSLEIIKRTGENVINTLAAVRAVVKHEQKNWPSTMHVSFVNDDSKKILDMVKDLKNHLITAVLLVMVIVIWSLGLRSALLVGVSIPGSFLMGILIVGALGFTINMVVLFSLILSVGMLVDGAIIVVEYADRKLAEGYSPREAYAQAAQRMFWPVITSTLTILVVFFPLTFWPGVVGEFMKYLPFTLLATLFSSLLMALLFVPTLGSLYGEISQAHVHSIEAVRLSEEGDLNQLKGLAGTYFQLLKKALERPKHVVVGAVGVLIGAILLYALCGKGLVFFPDVEPEKVALVVHARGNLSLDEKDAIVKEVEERVLGLKELRSVYSTSSQSLNTGHMTSEDSIGLINLEFLDWEHRRSIILILKEIEERVKNIPGVYVEMQKEQGGPGQGKPIQIELTSPLSKTLIETSRRLKTYVESIPGTVAVEDDLPLPGVGWEIRVNRGQAAKFGVDVHTIGHAVKLITNGVLITKYRPEDSREEVEIIARYPQAERTLQALEHLRVRTSGGMVPLSTFVERVPRNKIGFIRRVDGYRVATVKADIRPGFLAHDIVGHIKEWVAKEIKDSEASVTFKGEEQEKGETGAFLLLAFGAALFIMAGILVTQFNSFFSMFLVLSAVFMSTIGVFIGLIVMQEPFSIVMCGIGIIALAGIIVSNNIIFIDTFDQLKQKFPDVREAVLRTGVQRLRPVLLTKITAILGLLPMMFGIDIDYVAASFHVGSPSTQWWRPMAIAIVFGIAFASILTLVVTPCALMWRTQKKTKLNN